LVYGISAFVVGVIPSAFVVGNFLQTSSVVVVAFVAGGAAFVAGGAAFVAGAVFVVEEVFVVEVEGSSF